MIPPLSGGLRYALLARKTAHEWSSSPSYFLAKYLSVIGVSSVDDVTGCLGENSLIPVGVSKALDLCVCLGVACCE